ncbi:ArpU family phage transcriptional regulator [Paenibacillus sp. V4I3]|uniref:ArpU family phage packaging/lysis transcriptional regulator n=1 Tax=Paenibacillus sp. V4I3 TaxID=3042305 RepID=UPI00278AB4CE|nr:ArpU family phage packaging/lysis transcriptional regulator [Paenibacillus sp. V4I3]MDQ0873236.1 ArpU family phage transcriptional regulator [Paenibacillus sp. V4I3]
MVERILHIVQEQIDRRATRKRVEEVLETVRMYRLIGDVRRERGAITGSNQLLKVKERTAVYQADTEEQLVGLCAEVEQALLLLDELEQEMISKRYLQRDKLFDFLLFHELNLSERTYRRVKAKAIAKLAYMLRLEVILS